MTSNINRQIYNEFYSDENVRIGAVLPAYDRWIVNYRRSLVSQYGTGKDVLDLCCGTGTFLIPVLENVKSAIGVDFSSTMLAGFMKNLHGSIPQNLSLIEGDATSLPLTDQMVDLVFSYTALYHVPEVYKALREIGRILRQDGYAVLELGNIYSINTLICNYQYRVSHWAKPYHIPVREMYRYLDEAGLRIVDHRSFQLLNNYGVPLAMFYLYFLCGSFWKKLLAVQVRGRMLDEWISSIRPLRSLAFRHIFICQKD